jgi:hypothetical protein
MAAMAVLRATESLPLVSFAAAVRSTVSAPVADSPRLEEGLGWGGRGGAVSVYNMAACLQRLAWTAGAPSRIAWFGFPSRSPPKPTQLC